MRIDDATSQALSVYLQKALRDKTHAEPSLLATYVIAIINKHDKTNQELKEKCEAELEEFLHAETEPFVSSLFNLLEDIEKPFFINRLKELSSEPATHSPELYEPDRRDSPKYQDKRSGHSRKRQRSPSTRTSSRSPKRRQGSPDLSDQMDIQDSTQPQESSLNPLNPEDRRFRQKCKDYFQHGWCERGDACPFDHDRRAVSMGYNEFEQQYSQMLQGNEPSSTHEPEHSSHFSSSSSSSSTHPPNRNNWDSRDGGRLDRDRSDRGGRDRDRGDRGGDRDRDRDGRGGERRRNRDGYRDRDRDNRDRSHVGGPYQPTSYPFKSYMIPPVGVPMLSTTGMPMNVPVTAYLPTSFPITNPISVHPPHQHAHPHPQPHPFPHVRTQTPNDDVLVDVLQRQAMKDNQMGADAEYDPTSSDKNTDIGHDGDDNSSYRQYGRRSYRSRYDDNNNNNNRHHQVNHRYEDQKHFDPNNNTLVVVGIPHNINSIGKLDEHFSKFGHIVNIEVLQNQKKANVKFSSHSEAYKAFKSPEAIMGNRFIKVFWSDTSRVSEPTAPTPTTNTTTPAIKLTPEEVKRVLEENKKKAQEAAQSAKEKKTELTQKKMDQIKQKTAFLNKLIAQSKKPNLSKETMATLLAQIKTLSDIVKQDLASVSESSSLKTPIKTTSSSRSPTHTHVPHVSHVSHVTHENGVDTGRDNSHLSLLTDKLEAMRREALELGIDISPEDEEGLESVSVGRGRGMRGRGARGRGRGGVSRGRGRGVGVGGGAVAVSMKGKLTLDNRTSAFVLSNLPDGILNEGVLKDHFSEFGQVAHVQLEGKDAIIKMGSRHEAEVAVQKGIIINEHKSLVRWYNEPEEVKVGQTETHEEDGGDELVVEEEWYHGTKDSGEDDVDAWRRQ